LLDDARYMKLLREYYQRVWAEIALEESV
jgi:homoserine O-acetyltransferase